MQLKDFFCAQSKPLGLSARPIFFSFFFFLHSSVYSEKVFVARRGSMYSHSDCVADRRGAAKVPAHMKVPAPEYPEPSASCSGKAGAFCHWPASLSPCPHTSSPPSSSFALPHKVMLLNTHTHLFQLHLKTMRLLQPLMWICN